MELREDFLGKNVKKIEISDENQIGERIITTKTPILMYDAMNTIVTLYDPLKPLKTKAEITIGILSSLKAYTPKNEAMLWNIVHSEGLDDFANFKLRELIEKKLPPKQIFFVMVDVVTGAFCEKIGDHEQQLRVEVLSKMYKLADPRIFDSINEYCFKTFGCSISQLILTQDDPIMRKVYDIMLESYGIEIITIPDDRFEGLRKDNPDLYAAVAQYLNSVPNNVGFLDDSELNINAAKEVGMQTKLATALKDNKLELIEMEAEILVNQLFGEQISHEKIK